MDLKTETLQEYKTDDDPINDIIDYLVRSAKISFKNSHVNQKEVRTSDKIQMAHDLFRKSPTDFLTQFGKYLTPYHIGYFEKLQPHNKEDKFQQCIQNLKQYHSDESRRKRIRNRRYKALQKLLEDSDYFSEKQMMYRNPLLYEQLVGQYLTDDEIRQRDGVNNENLTFLNIILETVDQNNMRQRKSEQMLEENCESADNSQNNIENDDDECKKHWGGFDIPDTKTSCIPKKRKQSMISAPERNLLHKEFLQEMYNSFIEGRDVDIDYDSIDNDEQYDDLEQVSQDAEDKYFDAESNDVENLEEHMKLVEEYGRYTSNDSSDDDPLDVFMTHLNNKQNII